MSVPVVAAAAAVELVKDAAQMTAWDHMYAAKTAADLAKIKPLVVVKDAVEGEVATLSEHNEGLLHKIESALGLVTETPVATVVAPQASSPEQTQAPAPHESAIAAIELHAASLEGMLAAALHGLAAKLRSGEQTLTDEIKAELEKVGVKF